MRIPHSTLLGAATLLLATLPSPAQSVWVVDAAGGGDFTSLAAAAAAAADGDVLLVRDGLYGQLDLDGKGLTVVADEGNDDVVVDKVRVCNLAAGQTVTLRDLDIVDQSTTTADVVRLVDNEGSVWLEDCLIAFSTDFPDLVARTALFIEDCADVEVVGCTALGGDNLNPETIFTQPEAAVRCGASTFTAHRSTFIGGKGHPATLVDGQPVEAHEGAIAFWAHGGNLVFYDCLVRGGEGGDAAVVDGNCMPGASGGLGLIGFENVDVAPVDPVVFSAASAFEGGSPGDDGGLGCGTGTVGDDVAMVAGELIELSVDGEPRTLLSEPVVREGQLLELSFAGGIAGEFVSLVLSPGVAPIVAPSLEGALLPGPTFEVVPIAFMPGLGPLDVSLLVPDLGPALQGLPIVLQGAYSGQTPKANLGTATAPVLVDAGV